MIRSKRSISLDKKVFNRLAIILISTHLITSIRYYLLRLVHSDHHLCMALQSLIHFVVIRSDTYKDWGRLISNRKWRKREGICWPNHGSLSLSAFMIETYEIRIKIIIYVSWLPNKIKHGPFDHKSWRKTLKTVLISSLGTKPSNSSHWFHESKWPVQLRKLYDWRWSNTAPSASAKWNQFIQFFVTSIKHPRLCRFLLRVALRFTTHKVGEQRWAPSCLRVLYCWRKLIAIWPITIWIEPLVRW